MRFRHNPLLLIHRIVIDRNTWSCPLCEVQFTLKASAYASKQRIKTHLRKNHRRTGRQLQFWSSDGYEERMMSGEELERVCRGATREETRGEEEEESISESGEDESGALEEEESSDGEGLEDIEVEEEMESSEESDETGSESEESDDSDEEEEEEGSGSDESEDDGDDGLDDTDETDEGEEKDSEESDVASDQSVDECESDSDENEPAIEKKKFRKLFAKMLKKATKGKRGLEARAAEAAHIASEGMLIELFEDSQRIANLGENPSGVVTVQNMRTAKMMTDPENEGDKKAKCNNCLGCVCHE